MKYIKEVRSHKINFFLADYIALAAKLMPINWVSEFQFLNTNDCLAKFDLIILKFIDELPKSSGLNRKYPCWYTKELIKLIVQKFKAK